MGNDLYSYHLKTVVMIPNTRAHFFLLLLAMGFSVAGSIESKAQAPASIAGEAVVLTIQNGTGPFANSGSYRFLASAIDNTYGVIKISGNVADSDGTFTYASNGSQGTVNFNDSNIGVPAVTVLTFNSDGITGNFSTTIPSLPGASQTGSFKAYNGQGPSSVQGWIFTIQVDYGTGPFATQGSSAQLLPATTGYTYQIIDISGVSPSHGTYSYSLVSQSASSLLYDDSVLGSSYTQTLSWNTTTSGAYVARNSTGFQAGTFTAIPALTVTPSSGTNGTINPNVAQTVASGGSTTFTATPNTGYQVYQWLLNGDVVQTSGNSYTASNVTVNSTVQVTFQAVATITVSSSPVNGGNVNGGGTFAVGTPQTVRAAANSGYTFTNWTENGNVVSTSATYIFTLSANTVLVANFAALTAPIITSANIASFAVGQKGTYVVTATGNPTPTFSATGLPGWASLNSVTGVLSGTPTSSAGSPFSITLTASNGVSPNPTQGFTLKVNPAVNFSLWESNNSFTGSSSIIGPTATPENDGIPNLLKYLYDIDPNGPISGADRVALPTLGIKTSGETQYLTLSYRQYASASGITVNFQTSSDLRTWTTVTPDLSQQIGTDSTTGDPIMEMGVIATGATQFIRLNVTQP